MDTLHNYTVYHLHSDCSLLDSATKPEEYVARAVECGQTTLGFSEHGNILNWHKKKRLCEAAGLKYMHGVEIYLTETLTEKVKDNYHTVLIAKNGDGVTELNRLISMSFDERHFYYKNRLSFDEFLSLSPNIISTSACLASPLNKLPVTHPRYADLVRKYDYLEIQPHICQDQKDFNLHLAGLAQQYHKPLIAGTDTHSVSAYKGECRQILLDAKQQSYGNEDTFDLTWKTRSELEDMFRQQDALPEDVWMKAINNTNVLADSVEDFKLDTGLKYPILYGSAEKDKEVYAKRVYEMLDEKLKNGVIPKEQESAFRSAIEEELRVFEKVGMAGFMLSESELLTWCHKNGIVTGYARGSVGGSRCAYVTDVIDLNPETWHTVFSRFCNEDRVEVGDIDTDCIEEDRPKIFEYIAKRFGSAKTARVPTFSTAAEKAPIELAARGLRFRWNLEHGYKGNEKVPENPYSLKTVDKVKKLYADDPDKAYEQYPDIMYYYKGLCGIKTAQSVHAAGIVVSPIDLDDYCATFVRDKQRVAMIDMDEIHDCGLVKYDFLILNNVKIISDTCKLAGIPYPQSHSLNWRDDDVWVDMLKHPTGLFQFEGDFAYKSLKDFKPMSIQDMSLVVAAIRPSGTSYRNDLIAKKRKRNPDPIIDDLLSDNNGYLVYQEDVIKFLQQVCGLPGSEADNVRRAIGRKDKERLDKALPAILEGYCNKSAKPRDVAEKEAMEFIQILEDSSSYMFG